MWVYVCMWVFSLQVKMNVVKQKKQEEKVEFQTLLGSSDRNVFFNQPDVDDELASLTISEGKMLLHFIALSILFPWYLVIIILLQWEKATGILLMSKFILLELIVFQPASSCHQINGCIILQILVIEKMQGFFTPSYCYNIFGTIWFLLITTVLELLVSIPLDTTNQLNPPKEKRKQRRPRVYKKFEGICQIKWSLIFRKIK